MRAALRQRNFKKISERFRVPSALGSPEAARPWQGGADGTVSEEGPQGQVGDLA